VSALLATFEREVRLLIRSRHGVVITMTLPQVKQLLRAVNLPAGNSFLQKLRDCGKLRANRSVVPMQARYPVEQVVRLVVELNGAGE
jgi:hypothetical protein